MSLPGLACFLIPIALSTSALAEFPQRPTERDQLVLSQSLTFLLQSDDADLTKLVPAGSTLLLVSRTPAKTGFLQQSQIKSDLRKRTVPEALLENLQRRNTERLAKPHTHRAVDATLEQLEMPDGIVVSDLPNELRGIRGARAFEMLHPTARCWVQCYLPGYSGDGRQAIVRAMIGPTPHGATVTLLLQRKKDEWFVVWHELARYL